MVLILVVSLCPCLTCDQMAADDCCASEGASIGSACCVNEGSSRTEAPSTTALTVTSLAGVGHTVAIDAALPTTARAFRIPTRPAVARAILRI